MADPTADPAPLAWQFTTGDGPRGLADFGPVDVVICDPPYAAHVNAGTLRKRAGRETLVAGEGITFTPCDQVLRRRTVEAILTATRRWGLIFSDLESLDAWAGEALAVGLRVVRRLFWHKTGHQPQLRRDRPPVDVEGILLVHQNRRGQGRMVTRARSCIYEAPIVRGKARQGHASPKPLALMRALVWDYTQPGELVADCFAGRGMTGVAACSLGRRFVGWELDPRWEPVAVANLERVCEQGTILAPTGELALQRARGRQRPLAGVPEDMLRRHPPPEPPNVVPIRRARGAKT